ncbi:MAG TPA: hypothetical protein PKN39_02350 [Oscillospiraceae bacterium]|nr:hypothetical protein [Oscillospiraceae bacterium]
MKIKLFEAILHTGGKTAEQLREKFGDVTDEEIAGYLKVLEAMDGQRTFVAPSLSSPDEYNYMGLFDEAKGKEVAYLMEQDPMMGCYIDQREQFDHDYDCGDYCPDGTWTLPKDFVEIVGPLNGKIIALNSLKVVDFFCSDGECESVLADNTPENAQILLDAGFTQEELAASTEYDAKMIDLSLLAFNYTSAEWWQKGVGFTSSQVDIP